MVNTQVLQGQWNQVRGQLKKKWGQLTDDDLRFANGNIDQLIGRIQHKTGEAREAVEGFLDELTAHGASAIVTGRRDGRPVVRQAAEGAREGYDRVADQAARRLQPDFRRIRAGIRVLARLDPRQSRASPSPRPSESASFWASWSVWHCAPANRPPEAVTSRCEPVRY